MQQPWVCCNTDLPRDGAPIRFLLDDRMTSIRGTYSEGIFLSRWASYGAARVTGWCSVDINPDALPVAVVRTANNERSLSLLKQLNTMFARTGDAVSDVSLASATSHSNQMSS